MTEHRPTTVPIPYDWTTDAAFRRVLAETGETALNTPAAAAVPTAVFGATELDRVPDVAELARLAMLPALYDKPLPGTVEVRTADGRPAWVYLGTAPGPAPADTVAPRGVSRWAVNAAVLSLTCSGGAWMSALAVGEFAHAAAALAVALHALGELALVLAIVLGLLTVVVRKAGGEGPVTVEQTVNAHVTASGFLARARIDSASIDASRHRH